MTSSIRNTLLLWMLAGYLIFNYFFMQIRIPPVVGGGVPVGEIFLCLMFCLIYKDLRHLPAFTNNIIFVVFLMWWTLGIGRALYAVPEYGMWALRDASHVIESLFLWVGFVFAGAPGAIDRLFVWLRRILGLGCLYAFCYPFKEIIAPYMPTILSGTGKTIVLFSTYTTSAVLLIWEATRRLIGRAGKSLLIPGLLVAYAVTMFQARTIYLQVIAILLMLLWYRRKAFAKFSMVLILGLISILLLAEFEIEIKGRLGETISLDFIQRHFVAIAGIESEGVAGAAKGVSQRLGWWQDISNRLLEKNQNLIFGLGYGFPLIDFYGPDMEVVREPHNSYVSILGRIGLLGFLLFISAHMLLLRSWWNSLKLCRRKDYLIGQDRLFLLMVYFVLVWIYSIGEDAFEKPYFAITYYFFWGVFLQYRLKLLSLLNPTERPAEGDPGLVPQLGLIRGPELGTR